FFEAAAVAAREAGAGQLTPALIAKAAGKTQKVFISVFGNIEAYLSALQLRFFRGRLNHVVESLKQSKQGFDAIEKALTAYLDYTLKHHETYRVLCAARTLYPALTAEMQGRLQNSILMLQAELRNLGSHHSGDMSRLGFAVVLEVIRMENEARAKKPALREALWAALHTLAKA
ncbi:MAG: hypothetical protein ACRETE_11640, partial [Stenotrophobium sp.]